MNTNDPDTKRIRKKVRDYQMAAFACLAGLVATFCGDGRLPVALKVFVAEAAVLISIAIFCLVKANRLARTLPAETPVKRADTPRAKTADERPREDIY